MGSQALGGEIQQSCRGPAEYVGLLVVGERFRRENMVDRLQLKWIGKVAAQHDLTGADLGHQMPDRLGREDQRIEIDLLEIFRRRLLELDIRIAALWTDQTGMVRTIRVGRQVAAAMGSDHLELRKAIEYALEDEVGGRDRRLQGIAGRVGEPAVAGLFLR